MARFFALAVLAVTTTAVAAVNSTSGRAPGHSADLLPPGQPIVPPASGTREAAEDKPPRAPLPVVPSPIRPNGATQAIPGATAIPWMKPPLGLDTSTSSTPKPLITSPPASTSYPPQPSANATADNDDDDDDDDDDDAADEAMVVLGTAETKWLRAPTVAFLFAASALVVAVAAVVVARRKGNVRAGDAGAPDWRWARDAAGEDGAYVDAEASSAFLVADTR